MFKDKNNTVTDAPFGDFNDVMWKNVYSYLTQPGIDNNDVFISTAFFIENVLGTTGLGIISTLFVDNIRFANSDSRNVKEHRKKAMSLFELARKYI